MSKGQTLRALVQERLAAAAEDIFVLFERTIAEYEEELCRSKEENHRKQTILDQVRRATFGEVQETVRITSPRPGPALSYTISQTATTQEEPGQQRSVKHEEEQLTICSAAQMATEADGILDQTNDRSVELPSHTTPASEALSSPVTLSDPETSSGPQTSSAPETSLTLDTSKSPEIITVYIQERTQADGGAQAQKLQCTASGGVSGQSRPGTSIVHSPVYRFLRRRGVPERALLHMQQDRVDATVIGLMEDSKLADYLPALGDRLAVRNFCLQIRGQRFKSSRNSPSLLNTKHSIPFETADCPVWKKKRLNAMNNKWARKKTRKIEVGWLHKGKQVRKKKGGGTITVDVPRESKKADILEFAKNLFFPQGKNEIGRIERMTCDIVDYQMEAVIDDDLSVGDLYDMHKMGMLRFYLSTNTLCNEEDNSEETSEGQEDVLTPQDGDTQLFCGAEHEEPLPLTDAQLKTLVWERRQENDSVSIVLL